MMFPIHRHAVTTSASSDVAIGTAMTFIFAAAMLALCVDGYGTRDAPRDGRLAGWHLRGTLPPADTPVFRVAPIQAGRPKASRLV